MQTFQSVKLVEAHRAVDPNPSMTFFIKYIKVLIIEIRFCRFAVLLCTVWLHTFTTLFLSAILHCYL